MIRGLRQVAFIRLSAGKLFPPADCLKEQLISVLVVNSLPVKTFWPITPGSENRIHAFLIFASLLVILPCRIVNGQDNTLYLMPGIPQANQLNPAYIRSCGTYIELPFISSVKVNLRNSGFSFHDVFYAGTGVQADNYYLDLIKLDKKLKRINHFQSETDINLLGIGFGIKDWYFTFGVANHSDLLFSYPHDVALLNDNNLQAPNNILNSLILKGLGAEITTWNSIGISAAKEFRQGLKIGLRLKYLQGMANAIARRSELSINTTNNPVTLEAQMKYGIYASFPVIIGTGQGGLVNSLNFRDALNNKSGDYFFNGNRGMAIDAGFVYDRDEITQLSASIVDLGFIRWKKNANNFSASGNYLFNEADLNQLQVNPDQAGFIRALEDSISRVFRASASSYLTLIPVKIFGGITRVIMPNLKAGAMTRIEIYNRNIMPSLSLSMNYAPSPSVAASLSYTIMNNKFNQIGAGIALGNRIAQFYLAADNIPVRFTKVIRLPNNYPKEVRFPFIVPYYARMFSLRLGVNLLFGCNKKENKFHGKNFRRQDLCPAYW